MISNTGDKSITCGKLSTRSYKFEINNEVLDNPVALNEFFEDISRHYKKVMFKTHNAYAIYASFKRKSRKTRNGHIKVSHKWIRVCNCLANHRRAEGIGLEKFVDELDLIRQNKKFFCTIDNPNPQDWKRVKRYAGKVYYTSGADDLHKHSNEIWYIWRHKQIDYIDIMVAPIHHGGDPMPYDDNSIKFRINFKYGKYYIHKIKETRSGGQCNPINSPRTRTAIVWSSF